MSISEAAVLSSKILSLKREIEEEKKKKTKLEDSISHWLDQLQKDFGTKVIEEAKLQAEKLQSEINEAHKNIDILYEEIEEFLNE